MKNYYYKSGMIIEDSKVKCLAKASKSVNVYLRTLDVDHLNAILSTYKRKIHYFISLNKPSRKWFIFDMIIFIMGFLIIIIPSLLMAFDVNINNTFYCTLFAIGLGYEGISVLSGLLRSRIYFNYFDYLIIKKMIENILEEKNSEDIL